jgi:hypothetical protein
MQGLYLEPTSKMSFGPISLLVPRFKSFDPPQRTSGLRPTKIIRSDGKSSNAGRPTRRIRSDGESRNAGKLGPAARVPAKPFGEDGILNQNPIFEMGSIKKAVDNKTIVLYKRLILAADKNPWMIAKT